ncbi:hypothetical protein OIU34_34220 [Pararhizobium sp. BT-229]|nr:hypothetical protein [Pararhizobium sp. BT-229]MCV9966901.1 hypothetical protein [Pararhizobium sp. BT-229]
MSSAAGGAPSHRMIASSPSRSCFFKSAVRSPSMPQAWAIVVQSSLPDCAHAVVDAEAPFDHVVEVCLRYINVWIGS